jgi:hypothetical protein
MALNEDDLKFKLTVDPDTAKMQEAIKDIGKSLDEQARQAKTSWNALSKAGAEQLQSIKANEQLIAGLQPQMSAGDIARAKAMQSITRDMERQRDLLERINAEMNPKVLQERIALEKQLATAKDAYTSAHSAASGTPAPQGGFRQLLANLISGTGGVNIRQLAGAAIGGGAGGGIGGAAGAGIGAAVAGAGGPVGLAIGAAIAGLSLMKQAIQSLTETIAGFVQVASPAAFKRWEYTVRDLEGVIGRTLIPILELLTSWLRTMADILAKILPSAAEMSEALRPLREGLLSLGETMKELYSMIGPLVNLLIQGLIKAIGDTISWISKLIQVLVWAFEHTLLGMIVKLASKLTGINAADRSSFGAAARPAQFQGIEEYEKSFQVAALMASTGQSVQEKQLTVLEQIRDYLAGNSGKKLSDAQNRENYYNMTTVVDGYGQRRALFGHDGLLP